MVIVHQHDGRILEPLVRAEVEILLLTGKAMDFATRLRGHGTIVTLTHELILRYAAYAGIGQHELVATVLPALKKADLVDYTIDSAGKITAAQEFVGVSAPIVQQTVNLLDSLSPRRSDLAFLHSVELGAIAPLARSQHLEHISSRGFTDQEAEAALRLALAVKINLLVPSAELGEDVVFSPYVWGTKHLSLAQFLSELPPNERDALLGMSEQVLTTPGLHISRLNAPPEIIRSAQRFGLVQSATVQSATGASSTYVFSPVLEAEDDQCTTTEAFHLRKLFVAHILFGHEKARVGYGQINSPAVLVSSLVRRGVVGPATNIGTDYHLLEAAGVVAVDSSDDNRAFLRLVKAEIAEAGLEWIRRITDPAGGSDLKLARQPAAFVNPEGTRLEVGDGGASNEVMIASIHELRKEMQRAARRDDPWS